MNGEKEEGAEGAERERERKRERGSERERESKEGREEENQRREITSYKRLNREEAGDRDGS